MAAKKDDGFTDRALMALVTDLVAMEANVARVSVMVRTIAHERGIPVPASEEI
jgi:hypothetical protein